MRKKIKYKFSFDNHISEEVEFVLECEQIHKIQNGKCKYQTIVYLPFLTQSSWTDHSYENILKDRAIVTIESELRKRYQEIRKRDYNHRQRFDKFKEIVGDIEDIEIAYTNGLHHRDSIGTMEVNDIWSKLKNAHYAKRLSEIPQNYLFHLSWNKFVSMLINGTCSYCGLTIYEVYRLAESHQLFTKRTRGYTIEIDQIDPNGYYTDTNCTASCYWCNNAKTDEFSVSEFKEIAKGVNTAWRQRGANIVSFEKLLFWQFIVLTNT